jgi:hypothetical protein
MDRMGHAQITTTQKYLHNLPDADTKNLTALDRIHKPAPGSPPDPASQRIRSAITFKRTSKTVWTPNRNNPALLSKKSTVASLHPDRATDRNALT